MTMAAAVHGRDGASLQLAAVLGGCPTHGTLPEPFKGSSIGLRSSVSDVFQVALAGLKNRSMRSVPGAARGVAACAGKDNFQLTVICWLGWVRALLATPLTVSCALRPVGPGVGAVKPGPGRGPPTRSCSALRVRGEGQGCCSIARLVHLRPCQLGREDMVPAATIVASPRRATARRWHRPMRVFARVRSCSPPSQAARVGRFAGAARAARTCPAGALQTRCPHPESHAGPRSTAGATPSREPGQCRSPRAPSCGFRSSQRLWEVVAHGLSRSESGVP